MPQLETSANFRKIVLPGCQEPSSKTRFTKAVELPARITGMVQEYLVSYPIKPVIKKEIVREVGNQNLRIATEALFQ